MVEARFDLNLSSCTRNSSCPSVQNFVRTPWVKKQKPRKPTAVAVSSGAFNRNRTDDLEGLSFVSLPGPRAFSPAEGRSPNARPLHGALRALRKAFL